VVSFMLRQP